MKSYHILLINFIVLINYSLLLTHDKYIYIRSYDNDETSINEQIEETVSAIEKCKKKLEKIKNNTNSSSTKFQKEHNELIKLQNQLQQLQNGETLSQDNITNRHEKLVYHPIAHINGIGSSQFTEKTLMNFLHETHLNPNYIIDVDLRGEPHIFINGIPYYLEPQAFNNTHDLLKYEELLIKKINRQEPIEIWALSHKTKILENNKYQKAMIFKTINIPENAFAQTEKQMVSQLGMQYIKISNNDHESPTIEDAEIFIHNIKQFLHNQNYTFLIHCNAGQGRTTFYAIVLDMLMNGNNDSFDEIITRQSHTFADLKKDLLKTQHKRAVLLQIYQNIQADVYQLGYVSPHIVYEIN